MSCFCLYTRHWDYLLGNINMESDLDLKKIFLLFIYSHVLISFGPFLPPAPLPHLLLLFPPHFKAEPVLPLSLILLKKRHNLIFKIAWLVSTLCCLRQVMWRSFHYSAIFLFLVILGFELMVLHWLGRLSAIWATPPVIFHSYFSDKFSQFVPVLASDHSLPT
jgi:hypothetical protein